ncbi:MAG TPA: HAMP domain-containing sensor histidine kinase [Gemmatimonadaceae bacterium]|nr:HAMP domain-containing sensor histidine kinase [Gemmatimonadaceae bacterium]
MSEPIAEEWHRFTGFFEQLPRFAGATTIIIGAAMLAAWWLGMPALRGFDPAPPMPPLTALTFVLAGASLFLSYPKYASRWQAEASRALAILVIVIALIAGAERILGRSLGIDLSVIDSAVRGSNAAAPGRMAISSVVAFLLTGIGILLLRRDRRTNGFTSQIAALEVFLVAFIPLVGYAFGVRDFYLMQPFIGMALITAVTFVILGLGLLFSQLHRGIPGLVVDAGAAGVVSRRLLPGAILLPFIFGMIRLAGEQAGLFSSQVATSLFAVADILTFLLLVAWSARVLRVTDRKRAELFVGEREARMSSEKARSDAEAAKAEAEAARAEAESANGAKSDFLAVMSHELRTPLSAIMGYQELLADGISGPITEQQSQQLGRIKASARHLLSLIDEILTFTRIDAGREKVDLERASLTTILEPAAELVEPLARARGLHIEVMLPPNEVIVETDAVKVRQMIVNLLSNAVKFTDSGRIILSGDQKGDQLIVSVEDTGIGISPEHFERVFEPFWQVEQKATRRAGGTGLGLTVTRRLALLLGGDVTVKSEPGTGTTFTICLPVRPSESSPMIARAASMHPD